MYHTCFFLFRCFHTWINLIILDMLDFDIIIGMTPIFLYHAVLNFNVNTVTLEMHNMDKLEWECVYKFKLVKIISFIQSIKLVERGVNPNRP